ncbi:MAG: TIGR02996 domain-containing protein [Planctomycetes bacterium]|nr:TIGR02996 domain-containing protein [Planctomycetota bacterium]
MPRHAASTTEHAFLQPILDNPDDDLPRLVFADWLEERGDPRGHFIRLQCQRAKLTRYDPGWKDLLSQESALLKRFEKDWSMPILRHVDEVQYRRGFVEQVRVSASKLLRNADRLFRAAPIRSVRLEHADRLSEIAASPWLARIAEFDLSHTPLGAKSLQVLFSSEHCRSLRHIRLDQCLLAAPALEVVVNAAPLQALHTLSLAGNAFGPDGARILATSPLRQLIDLNLRGNSLLPEGAIALASNPPIQLTRLALGGNAIGNPGAEAIAQCDRFHSLQYLDLAHNAVGNIGLKALLDSPHLTRLEHLDLARNYITRDGIAWLTDSALLANLCCLNLKENEIDKPTLQTLPRRLQTSRMRELLF